ncbi:MAG: hypothetical protein ACLT46_05705 [Hungatella sp.]
MIKESENQALIEKKELLKSTKRALDGVYRLLEIKDVDPCVEEYRKILEILDKTHDIVPAREVTEQVIRYKGDMYGKVQQKMAEVKIRQSRQQEEKLELEHKIEQLERKKLSYPPAVNCVLEAIREEFARIGRKQNLCAGRRWNR